jgi:hypothetical protein
MSEKQGSGWFPTRKSRSVCFSRGGLNYHLQDETIGEGSEEDASDTLGSEEGEVVKEANGDSDEEETDDIRRAVWGLPITPGGINYSRIVQERPPIGSRFTARGGYTTPEGVVICRTLRAKVADLHRSYQEEADEQRRRPGWTGSQGSGAIPRTQAQPIIEDKYGNLKP